jgi:hypothetical protein
VFRQLASPEALAERKFTLQQKACALYLATIWLTSQYKVPFADFEGIPGYIAFTAAMYLVLPLTAVLHFAALLLVLGGYELLKSVQTDFVFSTKGALGLVAFSCDVHGVLCGQAVAKLLCHTAGELVTAHSAGNGRGYGDRDRIDSR